MADGNQISVEPSKAQNVADYNATNLDKLLGMYKQETPRKALVHLLSGGRVGFLSSPEIQCLSHFLGLTLGCYPYFYPHAT